MKNESGARIGPGMASMLMILVTLLMAALAILALAGAQNDTSLSDRNRETTESYYRAAADMQRALFEVDQQLIAARAEAQGDAAAYAQKVGQLQSGYIADDEDEEDDDAGDALALRLTVPMGDSHQIEARLNISEALEGLRYTLVGHRVLDTAPWDGSQDLNVYDSF